MKQKSTAGILALLLGGLGVHKFYLGKTGMGILYLCFCWTLIPLMISIVEAVGYFLMSQDKFDSKYNLVCDNITIDNLSRNQETGNVTFPKKIEEQKVWASPKYPEFEEFEKKIQSALNNKTTLSYEIDVDKLDNERWEYLTSKYPKVIKAPITSKYNNLHFLYKKEFEKLKPKIEAGYTICLSENEEKKIRPFCDIFLPNIPLEVSRPIKLSFFLTSLPYYDYKKKASKVKEILEYDSFSTLDLALDSANEYDYYAVKIMLNGYMLGYVSKDYSSLVHESILENKEVNAYISTYEKTGPVAGRIIVTIEISTELAP